MEQMCEGLRAREYALSKNHSLRNKLVDVQSALSLINDNDVLAIGGTVITRDPYMLIWNIIKAKKRNLTVVRTMFSFEALLFAVSGVAKKFITSWMSIAGPLGISKTLSDVLNREEIELEEWSHMGILNRFLAGSMGIPFIPTYTMIGSDLVKKLPVKYINCPFTGDKLCLVPAINPDVAIIHVQRADEYGNAEILGMPIQDKEIALSAKKVIISAEEIVSNDYIRDKPWRTLIPHFVVDAVVHAPFGAYPTECQGYYEADIDYLSRLATIDKTEGEKGIFNFINDSIYNRDSFYEFINSISSSQIIKRISVMKELMRGE